MKQNEKELVQVGIIALLIIGLMFSRALLSVMSVAAFVLFFTGIRDKVAFRYAVTAAILLLVPVLLSGIWSDDTQQWWRVLMVKAPLLTLAIGLPYINIQQKHFRLLSWMMIAVVVIASAWTTVYYIQHYHEVNASYLKASVLPTWLDNNHIHFSWLVVLTMIVLWQLYGRSSTVIKIFIVTVIAWFIFFLHLLAAKTGLVLLYISVFMLAVHLFQKNWKKALAVVAVSASIGLLVITVVPTVANRVTFIIYDYSNYSKGNYLPGLSDGNRWLSIQSGWNVFLQHPATGTGFGDIKAETSKWVASNHPQIPSNEHFLPLNNWIVYAAGAGVVGFICFTVAILLLMLVLVRCKNIITHVAAFSLAAPLLIDDTLEGQYGIVIFLFFLFWINYAAKNNAAAWAGNETIVSAK